MGPRHPHTIRSTAAVAVLALTLGCGQALAGDAYLGITMSGVSPSMARALKIDEGVGVLVDRVVAGSPAEAAGLQTGDVILQVDETAITARRDLSRLLREAEPGDEIRLSIQREGKQRRLRATLGERPRRQVDGRGSLTEDIDLWRWFGGDQDDPVAFLKDLGLTGLVRGRLGVEVADTEPGGGGAVVQSVTRKSPAADAGIQPQDRIVAIDDTRIESAAALRDHLDETRPGDVVVVRVERDGTTRDFTVELTSFGESLGLSELIGRYQGRGPAGPDSTWRFDWPGRGDSPPRPPRPPVSRQQLEAEREDLEDLREELEALKQELQKLRDELRSKRP